MMSDRPPMKNGMEWTVWKMWKKACNATQAGSYSIFRRARGWWRRGEVRNMTPGDPPLLSEVAALLRSGGA